MGKIGDEQRKRRKKERKKEGWLEVVKKGMRELRKEKQERRGVLLGRLSNE